MRFNEGALSCIRVDDRQQPTAIHADGDPPVICQSDLPRLTVVWAGREQCPGQGDDPRINQVRRRSIPCGQCHCGSFVASGKRHREQRRARPMAQQIPAPLRPL
jgi:hypothetical protein